MDKTKCSIKINRIGLTATNKHIQKIFFNIHFFTLYVVNAEKSITILNLKIKAVDYIHVIKNIQK